MSVCAQESLAGDAPSGKTAGKFGGWTAATSRATDLFQLGMVQNKISITRKEIVTLDETSNSFIPSSLSKSKLAEVGFED